VSKKVGFLLAGTIGSGGDAKSSPLRTCVIRHTVIDPGLSDRLLQWIWVTVGARGSRLAQ